MSVLEVREGERALRLHARADETAPATAVVVGHAILAFMPEARRTELLDASAFKRVTRYSLSRPALEARLPAIREQGYAIGVGGQYEDVMGVAAPVFDQAGTVRFAVAVGGPIERVRAHEAHVRDCVLDGAREMSRILGFDGHGTAERSVERYSVLSDLNQSGRSSSFAPPLQSWEPPSTRRTSPVTYLPLAALR